MPNLVIKNGKVVTPGGIVAGGLAIEDGVIVAIGADRALPAGYDEIDCRGRVVLPGMIDPHVHLGVGGSADDAKFVEDMTTETVPAAIGGVTTIVTDHENANGDSWVTTRIERDGEALLDHAKRAVGERSIVDIRFTANPDCDADLDEIGALVDRGVSSFKMFPSYVGEEAAEFGIRTVDYAFIFRALERIAAAEHPERPTQGMVHCEEPTICTMLKDRYRAEGKTALEWWTAARPAICEAMQVFDVGMMAMETGACVYIPHVSSAEGGRTIDYLHTRGVRIVGETCAHYLIDDIPWRLGAFAKINPPLRGEDDAGWLWSAIRRGTIEAVGSDNCRYCLAEKQNRSVWDAIPGVSEIGATLPIMLTEGIAAKRMTWLELARAGAENAARRFAMYPRKGVLSVGSDGDVIVVDPDERWTLGADVPLSGAGFSMYEGRLAVGRPKLTVRRGQIIAQDGEAAGGGGGRYVETADATPVSG